MHPSTDPADTDRATTDSTETGYAATGSTPTSTDPMRIARRSLFRPAIPVAAIAAVSGIAASGTALPAHAADGDDLCVDLLSGDELRAHSGAEGLRAVFVDGIDRPGIFVPSPEGVEGVDDGAATIVTQAGVRYRRLSPDGHVDVRWFGAVGDGETDDTDAIEAAVQEATRRRRRRRDDIWLGEGRPEVVFPIAQGYRTTRPIRIPVGVDLAMDADILADVDGDVAVEIGEEGEFNRQVRARVRVAKVTMSDWSDDDCVGVRLISAETGRFDIALSDGFTIGLQCIGIGQGFAYNHVELGRIVHSRIGVDVTCRAFDGRRGWACENLFLGGRFAHSSKTHVGQERIGVRITCQDGSFNFNDNNNFVKPSFELRAVDSAPAAARPILIEHGRSNLFTQVRDETNTRPMAVVLNESDENVIETGYGYAFVDDRSYSRSTLTSTRRRAVMEVPFPIAHVAPLNERACYYDGADLIHIPGLAFADPATGELALAGPAALVDGGVRISEETDHGPSLRVPTTRLRRFVVRRDVATGESGRVHVIAYDQDGERMVDPGDAKTARWVKAISEYPMDWDPVLFGGCYVTRPDHGEDMLITLRDEVASVQIIFWRGTGPLTLNGFAVQAVDPGLTSWSSGLPATTVSRTENVATQPPSKGAWPKGKIVYNAEPETRPGRRSIGWQKVTDGDSNVLGTDWFSLNTMPGN